MRKKYNTPHHSRVVKTRLSEDEYADFTARLAPYGISQSEFLRQAIRRTTIRPVIHVSAVNDELLSAVGKLAAEYGRICLLYTSIILSFLGRVQLEVVSALLSEKYKIETVVKEPTVIYMERPLKAASHTIHIEVPPNPFWASIGLSVTPLPLGSGVQYESRVSLGYLNQSFQNLSLIHI